MWQIYEDKSTTDITKIINFEMPFLLKIFLLAINRIFNAFKVFVTNDTNKY